MSRLSRGLLALSALGVLLVGVPYGLARFVGRPWPSPFPAVDLIWRSIRGGDIPDDTVIKALALLMWVAWIRLAVAVVIEIGARAAGFNAPRVVGLGSAQRWAAALVAAVVLLVGAGPLSAVASASGLGPRPISTALLQTEHQYSVVGIASSTEDAAVPGIAIATDSPTRTHTVRRHESFWSIAQDSTGEGIRWREIVDLNSGREVAPGVIFDGTPRRLLPGWELLVPGGPADVAVTPSPTPMSVATHTVLVEPGDTLSAIAADELGDPTAWPQLWEVNRGHAFGDRVFSDPNLILSGWELVIPGIIAPPSEELLPAPPPAPPTTPSIEAPSVEAPVGAPVAAVAPAVVDVAAGPPPTRVVQGDVEVHPLEHPVVERAVEPVDGPAAGRPPDATIQLFDQGRSDPVGTVAKGVVSGNLALPSGLGAAILVSSGVLGVVVARRRRQLRGAVVHARLAQPALTVARTEAVLRALDGGERIARLDVALRAAASELVGAAPGIAILGAIVGHDGVIDVLLTGSVGAAPSPWSVVTDHRWRLDHNVELAVLADAARRANQPCPAMAHLGSVAAPDGCDPAELFIDLEAIGLLVIDGEQPHASDVLRAIAAGVAVSPMSEITHVIACGLPDVDLGHPAAQVAESLDVALDLAASAIGTTAAMTAGSINTFTLRARHQGGEAWEPAIVFAVGNDHDGLTDRDLLALTSPGGRGLAVVVDRPVDGAQWRIEQRSQSWMLHPLGIEVTPVGLTTADLGHVKVLLDEAERPLLTALPVGVDIVRSSAPKDWSEPEWALMVHLLGPVEVTDREHRAVEFERSKALELVVWLSQHRDRSTRTAARTALWESNVRDATFANVVSDARRALARCVATTGGEEWIGRTLTEHLPLHSGVITDAEILNDRLTSASGQNATAAIELLRPGLALVRDMPFSGTSYLWPDAEGTTSQLTLLVTSAATELGGHYLSLGDTAGVFWATGQGLKVLAGHEELIALRMRAHARQGDLAGVRHEWETYERALSADTWSDGEPAPKLVALRRELLTPSLMGV